MSKVFALLSPTLQRALKEKGYTQPTPIQREAIEPILKGRDVMGCAQTGTGKTAAFCLPLLHRLEQQKVGFHPRCPRVLILAPTRELAAQIGENLQAYAQYQKIPCVTVFGGVNINPQIDALKHGVGVLVATPGRLLDLVGQGACELKELLAVVLDEADRMLDMGFLPDIRKILTRLPQRRQSLFFSATLSPEVTELAQSFIRTTPVQIRIDPGVPTVERICQKVFFVDKENKYALLKWLLDSPKCFRVIVFPRMKHGADRLAKQLTRDGFPAMALHGDKSQGARTRALDGFRSGKVQVLVATDIAARGIDVDDVTHVINYDLPDEAETYVHRIGRTARAGAEGMAYSLVCAHDRNALREIETFIKKSIPWEEAQPLHSEAARTAMGAAASRPPKQTQGRQHRKEPRPSQPTARKKSFNEGSKKQPFYQSHQRVQKGAKRV
jgi:ATP-dependent RNA helicase RhlE